MSHVAKIECEIQSIEVLKKTCEKLGLKFMENQKTYIWFGRHVGDYPVPEGMTIQDMGKCEHAIRVPGARYEVGVIRDPMNKSNYSLIWDFWDTQLPRTIGENAWKLTQAYTMEQAKYSAKLNGHMYRMKKMDDRERMVIDMGGMKQIVLDVMNETGETKVETKGYVGMKCVEESRFLKEALGKTVEVDLLPIAQLKENGEKQRLYKPICG